MNVISVQDEDRASRMNMSPKMLATQFYTNVSILVLDPGGSVTSPVVEVRKECETCETMQVLHNAKVCFPSVATERSISV